MRKPAVRYFASLTKDSAPEPLDIVELAENRYAITLRGRTVEVDAVELAGGGLSVISENTSHDVIVHNGADRLAVRVGGFAATIDVVDERRMRLRSASRKHAGEGKQTVEAPMPGKVVRVLVKAGDEVKEGQGVVVVEAMKMENELKSPKDGKIVEVAVNVGQTVEGGAKLVTVE